MVSSYPKSTAAAKGKGRPNSRPAGLPRPANDNRIGVIKIGSAGRATGRKIGGRLATRLIPGIGVALAIHDAWEIYQQVGAASEGAPFPSTYWETTELCGGSFDYFKLSQEFVCNPPFTYNRASLPGYMQPASGLPENVSVASVTELTDVGDYPKHSNPDIRLAHFARVHSRRANAPIPTPTTAPATVPQLVPMQVTAPMELPLALPYPLPSARPWLAPRPNEEPANKPRPEEAPQPHPTPAPIAIPPVPWPFTFIAPHSPPLVPSPTVVELTFPDNGGAPVIEITHPPMQAVDAPPTGGGPDNPQGNRKPDKEHKAKAKSIIGLTWMGINTVSEWIDFALAMHESILDPTKRLPDRASKAQKLEFMMTNLEPWLHIDLAHGLENFINMQIEDAIWALGSNQIKGLNQHTGSLTGLDRATSEAESFVSQEAEISRTDIAPEIDIIDDGDSSITASGLIRQLRKWKDRKESDRGPLRKGK